MMTLVTTMLFRRSGQNPYLLRAFEFGYIVTSPIATIFRRSPQNISFVHNDS